MAALLAVSVGLAGAAAPAQSAEEGESLFRAMCIGCHTIGAGRLVGPDLAGVTQRRTREWLASWILAPDQMLAANDPTALQLLQEHNNVPMPNLGLTEAQVAALIAYLESAPAASATTPAQAVSSGDPAVGRALFVGDRRFQNGGPPCMGCHSIGGIGALGGGALGPDLTPAYDKFGEAGLAAFLNSVPTVTMNAVWTRQPLTPDEQAHLAAFLKQAAVSGRPIQALGQLAGLSVAGAAVLLAAAHLVWRRRLVAVRRPLVERMRRGRAA